MNWNELITNVINVLLLPLVAYGLKLAKEYVEQQELHRAFTMALDAVDVAVRETAQTYTDTIKGTEDWTAEAQVAALDRAKHKALEVMGAKVSAIISVGTGDLNAWLTTAVEAAVKASK